MKQLYLFDNKITLTDSDGDTFQADSFYSAIKEIARFLKCSKTKANDVLQSLRKQYEVYAKPGQILLTQDKRIKYNFEMYGQTWYNGHKYNDLTEWDFKSLVEGKKIKKLKKPASVKTIALTCTERQIKKAKQLYYAHTIGFLITYKDYKRWHLLNE